MGISNVNTFDFSSQYSHSREYIYSKEYINGELKYFCSHKKILKGIPPVFYNLPHFRAINHKNILKFKKLLEVCF